MAKAKIAQALSFVLADKIGQLSAVSGLVGEANVNIEAILATESGGNAEFRLVTSKNAKAKKALAALGVEIREEDVVCVQVANKAGRLRKVAARLSEAAINVSLAWATGSGGKSATLVLQTSDNTKALAALSGKGSKKK